MFVGAVMPRQKTAFASEEIDVIVAPKDNRAAHICNGIRIVFSPRRGNYPVQTNPLRARVARNHFQQPAGERKWYLGGAGASFRKQRDQSIIGDSHSGATCSFGSLAMYSPASCRVTFCRRSPRLDRKITS